MKKNIVIKTLSLFVLAIFGLNSTVFAQDANLNKVVEQLQQQMSSMQQTIHSQNAKIATLEGQTGGVNIKKPVDPQVEEEKTKKMFEKQLGKDYGTFKDLKFSGDLRLRYEAFDYSSGSRTGATANTQETDPRNRFRYRLRMGLEKKFSDEISAGFSLASGDNLGVSGTAAGNVDPTSTNTTFDNNFNFKNIFIERAWATYKPEWAKVGPISGVEITGGKFKNPFERGSSDIVWDRDVRPEGIYESMDFRLFDSESVKATGWFTAGQFVLEEDGTVGNATAGGDANLYAFQIGVNPKLKLDSMEKPLGLTSALSLYNFSNYANQTNSTIFGTSLARGNSNLDGNTTQLDAVGFNIIEIYNELKIPVGSIPVRPFFDYVHNMDDQATIVNGHNNAYGLGVTLGEAKTKGQWEVGYAFKYIGADSTAGAFGDSDFGDGHNNKRGSVLKAKYMLTDYLEFGLAGFLVDNIYQNAASSIPDLNAKRFQADLVWKW